MFGFFKNNNYFCSMGDSWYRTKQLLEDYLKLQLHEEIDYEKFYLYSIIAHSTAIEGSSLTELDTQLLLDDGITAQGKPLVDHTMNNDLYHAYQYAYSCAERHETVTTDLLKAFNAHVMKTTGTIMNTMAGTYDSSKGDFRLQSVRAGTEGPSYMDYRKVPIRTEELCQQLQERLGKAKTLEEKYNLSFDAHLNLVTIHPWVDGNGRTSRLLMNYIQKYFDLVPTKVFVQDKEKYIQALVKAREEENPHCFRLFMQQQLNKSLKIDLQQHEKSINQSKGFHLLF